MAAVRVAPMLATPGSVLLGDGFAYEMKFTRRLRHASWRGLRPDATLSDADWPG